MCRAEKIFGESIEINPKAGKRTGFFDFFNSSYASDVKLIECTELNADELSADIIRASKIKIGKRCEVNLVEYSEAIDIHPEAKIKELIKI